MGSRALKKSRGRRRGRATLSHRDDEPRSPGRPAGASGDRTRERVVAAALATFAEQGFAGTSVRDIARKARIRVSSLYHYFPSKESLYQEVHTRVQDEWRELVLSIMSKSQDLREIFREATGRLIDYLIANPAYVRLAFRNRLEGGTLFDRPTIDRWLGLIDGVLKPAEMQGLIKPVDPVPFMLTVDALVHWHVANDTYYRTLLGKGLDDPEIAGRVREHVIQVMLRAVGLE